VLLQRNEEVRGADGRTREVIMRERTFEEEGSRYNWIVYAIAMLLVGGLAGYMLAATAGPPPRQSQAAPPAPAAAAVVVDENALKAYQNILSRDPKNVEAAVGAGNLLYDAKRYIEAIPYYQQALALRGGDVNVSTDLGTALWYSGRADEALTQYAKSLSIDPHHAQTLFNLGIVKSDGKGDYRGAVEAWQLLLDKNPTYPNAVGVQNMIANARRQIGN
jgi:tetratricopeptide (TPR) repeat protein